MKGTKTGWYRLHLKSSGDNQDETRKLMKLVDDRIQKYGATMNIPPGGDGLPISGQDGTFEVRTHSEENILFVKAILKLVDEKNQFEIVSEKLNN